MNGGYCLWLYLVSGTNGIENNGIMRDYDVIKCESYCAISQKKNQNFGTKLSAFDHMVAASTQFLNSLRFWRKWAINGSIETLFWFEINL